jgi:hypothetical protein
MNLKASTLKESMETQALVLNKLGRRAWMTLPNSHRTFWKATSNLQKDCTLFQPPRHGHGYGGAASEAHTLDHQYLSTTHHHFSLHPLCHLLAQFQCSSWISSRILQNSFQYNTCIPLPLNLERIFSFLADSPISHFSLFSSVVCQCCAGPCPHDH